LNLLSILDVLIDNDLGLDIELRIIFARNIKKEIIGVIDYLFFFLTRYDEWKAHNQTKVSIKLKFHSHHSNLLIMPLTNPTSTHTLNS